MATSTFERKIVIKDPESIKKLIQIMAEDVPKKSLYRHLYTEEDRKRSDELLKQCLSRSRS